MPSRADRELSDAEHIAKLYGDIYAVVRKIPKGRVVTYGQVAELAGRPGAARVAGAAMRCIPPGMHLPWQRVIGKRSPTRGKISILDPIGGAIQRGLLEDEGIEFTASDGIDLAIYGWVPL